MNSQLSTAGNNAFGDDMSPSDTNRGQSQTLLPGPSNLYTKSNKATKVFYDNL